jgi:hypothetical protein
VPGAASRSWRASAGNWNVRVSAECDCGNIIPDFMILCLLCFHFDKSYFSEKCVLPKSAIRI